MILSFYDKNFKGLQNNASLVIDNSSYKLIKKPIELNELSCVCEAFTEDIQPTFLIIKDDIGGYVYGSLAGIPELNSENKTEINGTDLKTMLSSDVVITPSTYSLVQDYFIYLFDEWNETVMQETIPCELIIKEDVKTISMGNVFPANEKTVVNALEEIQTYLKYYNLYLDTKIDLVNKKVQFIIGKTMINSLNVKLWEYGIKNYGKWVADINECQGYYVSSDGVWTAGFNWILNSKNEITTKSSNRDIFPVKRRVIVNEESLVKANIESLTTLLDSMYNENIELEATNLKPDFETNFIVYLKNNKIKSKVGVNYYAENDTDLKTSIGITTKEYEGDYVNNKYSKIYIDNVTYLVKSDDTELLPYKDLPCGYLQYDASGLVKFQIGYRYTDIKFI